MKEMKLEILHVRDPDGWCNHTVFVNGEPFHEYDHWDVDAGAGGILDEWDERTKDVKAGRTGADFSPAYRAAVVKAMEHPPGRQYLT